MESEQEVVVNGVLTNQVLRRLLRDSPHLVKAAKTKKRSAKLHETSFPQPPKPKKRKVVKRDLEIPVSSSQPIEIEIVAYLDAEESTQALTIYTPPIFSTPEEISSLSLSTSLSPEIQINILAPPIIEC